MFGKLKAMVDEQEKADAEKIKQDEEEQKELAEKEEEEKRNAEREEMEKALYGNTLSLSRKKKLAESLEKKKQEDEERKKSKELDSQKKGIDITRKAPRKKMDPYRLRLLSEIPGLPSGDSNGNTAPSNNNDESIDLPGVVCHWADLKKDIRHFDIYLTPQEGRWQHAKVHFLCEIPTDYPISPPKVKCDINTRVYHPNIDLNGNVCLSILKVMNNNNEGWKPVLGISHLLFGLLTLFYDPNPDDPLNHTAAKMMINDGKTFDQYCHDSIRGGHVEGSQFPNIYQAPKY